MGVNKDLSSLNPQEDVDFGILFDIDGVIARGSNPLEPAKTMIRALVDGNRNPRVPFAFVTNGCNPSTKKAQLLSQWLDIDVSSDHVLHAQSPLAVFESLHNKHVLISGQGPIEEIARDLGFTNTCTIEDLKKHYPALDIVDHDNRAILAQNGYKAKEFPRVEAIVMFGEPKRWESSLQIMVDLLLTNGKPIKAPEVHVPNQELPVIVCNADLMFMAEACMPRFGHGAYVTCLEALYKKITGRDLQYHALVGKPGEITLRYAEHVVSRSAKEMGLKQLKTLYLVGDNPEVDIFGANLYHEFVQSEHGLCCTKHFPASRLFPAEAEFSEQTVTRCRGVLVETGVFCPKRSSLPGEKPYHGHRDFEFTSERVVPWRQEADVEHAVAAILREEGWK